MNSGNKKIIKNTALLYARMLLSMVIGLYSVRIVLEALGEVDFGIYNVVGGIVTMLAFFNNALSSTTQRFLSYENGKNNVSRLRDIFNNSMSIYLLLCVFILIVAETVGLWAVNKYLIIPKDKILAANIIYQFSIFSFIFSILVAPYNAVVIAREKMEVFAYISIVESIIKLGLVLILLYVDTNKLVLYGFMMMSINLAILGVYYVYCRRRFAECNYIWRIDKLLSKEIGSFASWNIWGAFSNIFSNQGLNILLNRFFGVIVNAARGIAYQVNGALNTCVQNFLLAVRPQAIKSYAAGDYSRMNELLILSTRISFYLMFVITLIFIFNIDAILKLWLGSYPDYTSEFVCLVLISTLLNILAQPLVMLIMATGKIKNYQFFSGLNNIIVFPLSYLFLRIFDNPYIPFYVLIGSNITYYTISLINCNQVVTIPKRQYFTAIIKLVIVCICNLIVLCSLPQFISNIYNNLVISIMVIMLVSIIFIILFDLTKIERKKVWALLLSKI